MLKVIDMWLGWARSSLGHYESPNSTEEGKKGVLKLCNRKVTDVFWVQKKHQVGSGTAF